MAYESKAMVDNITGIKVGAKVQKLHGQDPQIILEIKQ